MSRDRHLLPPEPASHLCARCGEPAYDPHDREDAPWAPAAGDGVVCGAACELADKMDALPAGPRRAAALRDALGEGVEVELARVVTRHGLELVLGALEWTRLALRGEDAAGLSIVVPWDALADAEVVEA